MENNVIFKKSMNKKFIEELSLAKEEREVDFIYDKYIQKIFNVNEITHPFKCDGLIDIENKEGRKLKILFEYKYNFDFNKKYDIAAVLIQVLFYLKKFEKAGHTLPNVIFIGDVNECFVMTTNALIKYLDEDVDWNHAPSNAKFVNSELINKLISDENIAPFIFEIKEGFNWKNVINEINKMTQNVQKHIDITEYNIESVYQYFYDRVLMKNNNYDTRDVVALFIGILTDSKNYYLHPKKKNTLVAQPLNKEFSVKSDVYKAFFNYFKNEYSINEKRVFTGIADRLIDDTDRRRKGDFWTPTNWVHYAIKRLDETLGENWREEYVVWDCCAGTCNLTRDYKFKELYVSTLDSNQLTLGMKYNKEATHFQFDFLNDEIPMQNVLFNNNNKLPEGLLDAFRNNKKIVFFMNPPFLTSANRNETSKKGATTTEANKEMIKCGYGKSAQNTFAQFLYVIEKLKREYDLSECHIALFSPTIFMSGGSFAKFRSHFLNDFEYLNGFQFQASHFADVSDNWGIGFTIWKSGVSKDKENFVLDICDVDKTTYGIESDIENKGQKCIYNIDSEQSLRDWAKTPIKSLKTSDVPNLSSGIKIKNADNNRGRNFKNAFGFINCGGNNVDQNAQMVAIFSSVYSNGHGFGINKDNFLRCTCLFAARRLITANWMNWTDEYLAPDINNPNFEEFTNDSVIYSLFESKSNQSSLHNVIYKDKKWPPIKNEFFWMSHNDILNLADVNNNEECYNDALNSEDRYVYKYLQNVTLSKEAQDVLDFANKLVKDSFKFRENFNIDNPNYQINNWDCGYYQLKALWKDYMSNEFKQFRDLFNKLADKMRPQVYELGFLKK